MKKMQPVTQFFLTIFVLLCLSITINVVSLGKLNETKDSLSVVEETVVKLDKRITTCEDDLAIKDQTIDSLKVLVGKAPKVKEKIVYKTKIKYENSPVPPFFQDAFEMYNGILLIDFQKFNNSCRSGRLKFLRGNVIYSLDRSIWSDNKIIHPGK